MTLVRSQSLLAVDLQRKLKITYQQLFNHLTDHKVNQQCKHNRILLEIFNKKTIIMLK